jgi:hypothetical protein
MYVEGVNPSVFGSLVNWNQNNPGQVGQGQGSWAADNNGGALWQPSNFNWQSGFPAAQAATSSGGNMAVLGNDGSGTPPNPYYTMGNSDGGGTPPNPFFTTTSTGAGGQTGAGNGGFNLGSIFNAVTPIVGGAIDANRQGQAAQNMLSWMNNRDAAVQNTYSPGSPEFNQLWEEMSRKDAAAGRNSQYGPRTVDLAARLAQVKSDNLVRMTQALAQPYSNALNQDAGRYTGLLSALGNQGASGGLGQILSQLGGNNGSGYGAIVSGLSRLFGGGASQGIPASSFGGEGGSSIPQDYYNYGDYGTPGGTSGYVDPSGYDTGGYDYWGGGGGSTGGDYIDTGDWFY